MSDPKLAVPGAVQEASVLLEQLIGNADYMADNPPETVETDSPLWRRTIELQRQAAAALTASSESRQALERENERLSTELENATVRWQAGANHWQAKAKSEAARRQEVETRLLALAADWDRRVDGAGFAEGATRINCVNELRAALASSSPAGTKENPLIEWLESEQKKPGRWGVNERGIRMFRLTGPELMRLRHAITGGVEQ